MSIKDEEPFENIINLTQIVVDAECGEFKNISEINKEFANLRKQLTLYREKTIQAFKQQNNCKHEEYGTPKWSLRKNILNYYYHFEKRCKCCGHVEFIRLEEFNPDKDEFPEGYSGAEKEYYNLNI